MEGVIPSINTVMKLALLTDNSNSNFSNLINNLKPIKILSSNSYGIAGLNLQLEKEIFLNSANIDFIFYAKEDDPSIELQDIEKYSVMSKFDNYIFFTKRFDNRPTVRHLWMSDLRDMQKSNFFCSVKVFGFIGSIYKCKQITSNSKVYHLLKTLNVSIHHLYYD
jgi:hypothetical protein